MRSLMLVLLLFFAFIKGLSSLSTQPPLTQESAIAPSVSLSETITQNPVVRSIIPEPVSSQFVCDGREHCSQMTSKAEAQFFVRNCPNVKMDGDNDGDACENDTRF